MEITPKAKMRFWKKVNKDTTTDCWHWAASLDTSGYGRFWDGTRHVPAHRFSYLLHTGTLDQTLFVCHKCDNPLCVNPAHLWQGSHRDNMADMAKKGRGRTCKQPIGENAHNATLTEEQAIFIIQNYGELTREPHLPHCTGRWTLAALGRKFNVSRGAISHIIRGHSWSHLERPVGYTYRDYAKKEEAQ